MTTKADRIRKLLKAGFTSNEVAGIVKCLPEYVRAVKQRPAPRMTKSQELIKRWSEHPNWKTQGVRRHG